ncbi:sterol desaturase family protein [Fibrella aquatica]|uniref:sterol desaturase family protein n=1 Tax=Fibrella aquatica TaxID=3242487 RepID=UPI003521BCF1
MLLKFAPGWGMFIVWMSHLVRYLLVAGLFFAAFYGWKRAAIAYKKIQPRFPKSADYRREILYSISTTLVFAGITWLMVSTNIRAYNLVYVHWAEYGTAYGLLSFVLLILFHDTYFYWTHRAMHHPRLFKATHLVHHKSTNPSPWAAYAFHPIEAIVEAAVIPLATFVIPLHPITILVFLFFMIVYNVYGHLGWELFPTHWNRHWLARWLNTSVNHNQHHQYFKGNYGLYFRFWDEWMGTTRADYGQAFERVTTQQKQPEAEPVTVG